MGKTVKQATVKVKVKKNVYVVKSNKKGIFKVPLMKKIKHNNKIKITVSKSNYHTKTKSFKVK